MGHYDSCYEAEYERERLAKVAAATRYIPLIISDLESARNRIEIASRHVNFANRIAGDIEFVIAALRGQVDA